MHQKRRKSTSLLMVLILGLALITGVPAAVQATDTDDVASDLQNLEWEDICGNNVSQDEVTDDLTLPTVGANGSSIVWESSNSDLISIASGSTVGVVTAPGLGETETVTLTATVTKGQGEGSKNFELTLRSLAAVTGVEATPNQLTADGGDSRVDITGYGFDQIDYFNIYVNDALNATAPTTTIATSASYTINLPANTSTSAVVYTIAALVVATNASGNTVVGATGPTVQVTVAGKGSSGGSGGGGGGGSSSGSYTVSFNSNGGSFVPSQLIKSGGTVTKPADPTRAGYTFTGWYTNTALSTAYDFSTEVKKSFTLYAGWKVGDADLPFSDIKGHWAQNVIVAIAERGVINGYPDGTFKPNNPITRAEFLTMLMRTLDPVPPVDWMDETPFPDAESGSYYYDTLLKAKALGIAEGYETGRFNPDTSISRQDMFLLTYRTLVQLELMTPASSASLSGFSDSGAVAPYAVEAMSNLVHASLVQGSNGQLNPTANATRAETAQFIYNVLEKILK